MRLLYGKMEVVAPISAPMLQMVPIPEDQSSPGYLLTTVLAHVFMQPRFDVANYEVMQMHWMQN